MGLVGEADPARLKGRLAFRLWDAPPGVFGQHLYGLALGVGLAQEGFVGRVFQKAAYQIGHAGNELSHRGVDPERDFFIQQRHLHRLGHAEKYLVLHLVSGDAEKPGVLQHHGDGAQIVTGAGQAHRVVIVQNQPGHLLEVGVGLVLVGVDRDRPAVLPGLDRFEIPVGSLYQTHRYRGFPPAGPGD